LLDVVELQAEEIVEGAVGEMPTAVGLDPGLDFEEIVVGPGGIPLTGDGGGLAGAGKSRLIYSNTLGIHAYNFPSSHLVSDDIVTTAPDGCQLTSFKFKVLGKVLPTGLSGPFTVKYALYENCPSAMGTGSAGAQLRELIKIPGTSGEIAFPDDAPRTIKHVIDSHHPVPIPANVYLGLQFNRGNCGTVVGAPAMVGFSADRWDSPNSPCNAYIGGFPNHSHASFWLEMYGDATCGHGFPGYKASRPSGGVAALGAMVQGVDDIKLQVEDCLMIGYEVVVRGVGFYWFDLRRQCDGQIIAGTEKTFQVTAATTPQLQVARFRFDPPILLPDDDLYFGFRGSHNSAGAVIAGIKPDVGESGYYYFIEGADGCELRSAVSGVYGAVNLAVTCLGSPPMGACCDMGLLECEGTAEPTRCRSSADCPEGTTCEAVCREVPEMNCPWPTDYSPGKPEWIESGVCEPDPFELPCGVAACCKPDDTCENLTKNECAAVEPLNRPRLWQMGMYCGQAPQSCPFNACLAREGNCFVQHEEPGCSDPFCCEATCERDSWCCLVDWDRECVRQAESLCSGSIINLCTRNSVMIAADSTTYFTNALAWNASPEFCCNAFDPGATGFGIVWFKFVATDSSIEIDTCESDSERDSLINVFSVGDPTTDVTACSSLSLVGCGDDGCGNSGRLTRLCVGGLVPGSTYYIAMASKSLESKGTHQLKLRSPAQCSDFWPSGDCNQNGQPDGCDLVDQTSADCNNDNVPDECQELATSHTSSAAPCVRFGQTIQTQHHHGWPSPSVAIDGDWMFVGAPEQIHDGFQGTGAVMIHRRSAGSWAQSQLVLPPHPSHVRGFGSSLAVSGPWAFVLGYEADSYYGQLARVYIYRLDQGVWTLSGDLGRAPENLNWRAVKLDGNTAALAAASDLGAGFECSAGVAIFSFRLVEGEWLLESRIPRSGSFGECGFGFDLRGNTLAVVSSIEWVAPESWYFDSVQIFEHTATTWNRSARFEFPDNALSASISVHGHRVAAIGIEPSGSGGFVSVAHLFIRSAKGWLPEMVLRNPDASSYFVSNAVALCHGGLVGMVVTGSDAPCTRVRFAQRLQSGNWETVCDFPFPTCTFNLEQQAAFSCGEEVAAVGVSSKDGSSVFAFNVPSVDCNENFVADACERTAENDEDCNRDFTLDRCDDHVWGDADFSGRVDLSDFAAFQRCLAGRGGGLAACCGVFDAEPPNGDIDLEDLAVFVPAMSGP
jgi:hypothetical protein